MALDSNRSKFIQFEIPFHKDCQDFIEFSNNINKIEDETGTKIELKQVVHIVGGNNDDVEEARRRVGELNCNLSQNENKEIYQILKDIQNKITDLEREKVEMGGVISKLFEDNMVLFKGDLQSQISKILNHIDEAKITQSEQNQDLIQIIQRIRNDCIDIQNEELDDFQSQINSIRNLFLKRMNKVAKSQSDQINQKQFQDLVHAINTNNIEIKEKLATIQNNDLVNENEERILTAFTTSPEYINYCQSASQTLGLKPIHVASCLGRIDIVQTLLKKGVSVNTPCNNGSAPLHFASQHGHLNVVAHLINQNALIDHKNITPTWTPLQFAAASGRIKVVEYLCSKKANKNIRDKDNKSALDLARSRNYTNIVNVLKNYNYSKAMRS